MEKVNLSQQLGVMTKDKAALELSVGALKIKDKDMQEKVSSLELLLAEKNTAAEKLSLDVEWLLKKGVPGAINKVFDSSEFVAGVKSFRKACLVAGEALGCDKVLSALEALEREDAEVDPVVEAMEVALEKFALVDYPSIFNLEKKEVAALEAFVAVDEDEGVSGAHGAT